MKAINERFGSDGWKPVIYLRQHHGPDDVAALYRAADVCVVSSLHDGMNLVAKEFIASRPDLRGVLVLSRFTGAARELREAVDVNPFAVDEFAGVLHQALTMPEAEQERRMRALRTRVEEHTIYDWAAHVIQAALAHVRSGGMKLDHGAIGNGRVLALVGPDTSIDWLCLPRFDSPSIFARLLDAERGGRWAFEPLAPVSSTMAYVRNTNVLRTEVVTEQGRCELFDFAPWIPDWPERRRAGRDPPAHPAARRRAEDSRVLRPATRLRAAQPPVTRADHGRRTEVQGGPLRSFLRPTCRRRTSTAASRCASTGRCSSSSAPGARLSTTRRPPSPTPSS